MSKRLVANFYQFPLTTTAKQIPPINCKRILFKADDDNTGSIYIGNSEVSSISGFRLKASQGLVLKIEDTQNIWVVATSNAQILYLAVEQETT